MSTVTSATLLREAIERNGAKVNAVTPGTLEHARISLTTKGVKDFDMDQAVHYAATEGVNRRYKDSDLNKFVAYCKLGSLYFEWWESTKDTTALNKAMWYEYKVQDILKKLANKAGQLLISEDVRTLMDQQMEEIDIRLVEDRCYSDSR